MIERKESFVSQNSINNQENLLKYDQDIINNNRFIDNNKNTY